MAGVGQSDALDRTVDPLPRVTVPVPLTSLVGRAQDLAGIGGTLARARLVTVTGPGGVGKTRVALELARRHVARNADSVWLVDLAASPDSVDVGAETARALELRTAGGAAATQALARYLRDRSALLVVDNCEHVIEGCAALAAALLTSCAKVRILVTSREPLGVDGETVWRLGPLAAQDAHRLFVERARQRQPNFIPSKEADATIARLCARLDRLPLAIELAAARVGVMSLAEILSGLEVRLGDLSGGYRLAPAHHRSVRAAVEWSHRLLDPVEQRALRNLGVFVGGFDAAAGKAVAPGLSAGVLARLVDKSLITPSEDRRGRTRYRLLETVREYALELLVDSGDMDDAHTRHLRHFTAFGDLNREGWPSATAQQLVDEVEDDYENVRAALERAADSDPCQARRPLAGMYDLFLMLGQADGLRLGRLVLERCPARDRLRASLEISTGLVTMLQADPDGARQRLTQARELSAELGEQGLEGWACFFLGLSATLAGSIDVGRGHLEAALALHRELGLRIGEARATAVLGLGYELMGDSQQGQRLAEEALAIYEAESDEWGKGHCHLYLGIIAESIAPHSDAVSAHYRHAVYALRPYRDTVLLPVALIGQAGVLARRDPKAALTVTAAAFAIRARGGGNFAPVYRARADRVRATVEAAAGADAERLWSEGARLSVDDAIALAFGTKQPRPAAVWGLTAREAAVARLVADGLSNKQIGAHLHLSVRTVESHVRPSSPRPAWRTARNSRPGRSSEFSSASAIALMPRALCRPTVPAQAPTATAGHHGPARERIDDNHHEHGARRVPQHRPGPADRGRASHPRRRPRATPGDVDERRSGHLVRCGKVRQRMGRGERGLPLGRSAVLRLHRLPLRAHRRWTQRRPCVHRRIRKQRALSARWSGGAEPAARNARLPARERSMAHRPPPRRCPTGRGESPARGPQVRPRR